MNNINLVKYNYKISTRNYSLSSNNNYKIPSIGLIKSFKILNYDEIKNKYNDDDISIILTIGNFPIYVHKLFKDDINVINIEDLRNYIRNLDYIITDYEHDLLKLDNFIFSQQIKCTEHYYTINNKDLQNALFTSGINVYIDLRINKSCEINESSVYDELSLEYLNNMQIIDEELKIEETFWDKIYDDEKP